MSAGTNIDEDDLPDEWTAQQREVFGRVFRFIYCNQDNVKHPKASSICERHWRTVAWNAAFVAANALCDTLLVLTDSEDEVVLAAEVPRGALQ